MEVFYLNPFIFIAKHNEQYLLTAPNRYVRLLSSEQATFLMKKEGFSLEGLLQYFGLDEIEKLKSERCIITEEFDLEDRNSRTLGYFYELNLLKEYKQLQNKNILLLGAGALGTHMGWALCAMGIEHITILDYDVIEESNLNRQILYTTDDIGKLKVEALKNHLISQNPDCSIITINRKIECMDDLYEVITNEFDLVVRGIDTPVSISNWVFTVCEKVGVAYVSGGTIGTRVLLGPSYIPGVSPSFKTIKLNGNDMYTEESDMVRVFGTGVSTNFAINQVVAQITLDAVNILLGQYDYVRYNGRVQVDNLFSNEPTPSEEKSKEVVNVNNKKDNTKLLLYLFFTGITMSIAVWFAQSNTLLLMFEYLLLTTNGVLIWHKEGSKMYKSAVIGGSLAGIINVILSFCLGRLTIPVGNSIFNKISIFPTIIFTLTLMMCLHAMLFCAIEGIISFIISKSDSIIMLKKIKIFRVHKAVSQIQSKTSYEL